MKLKISVVLFLLLMFGFRIFLSVNAKHGDMYNSLDWGYGASEHGLAIFYDLPKEAWPHSRPNQPPGSIYLHLASVEFSMLAEKLIDWSNTQFAVFPSKLVWWWDWNGELAGIKLPPMIADFAIVAAILTFGKMVKRYKSSLVVACIYLVNPALWYSSAYWGHTDAAVAAFSIWSFVTLFQKRIILSPILLGISLIIKASWMFIVPFYTLYYLINHRSKFLYILAAPATMIALSIPFHPHLPTFLPWFWDLFVHRILPGDYTFITILAFNFWNLIYGPAFVSYTTPFLGLPVITVAWMMVAAFLLVLGIKLVKSPNPKTYVWLSMLLAFAVFLFAPKMIHRYLYPAFPLLSLALVYFKRSYSIWIAYVVMSAAYLINIYYLWWAPGNLGLESWYTDINTRIISIVYLLIFTMLFLLRDRDELRSKA